MTRKVEAMYWASQQGARRAAQQLFLVAALLFAPHSIASAQSAAPVEASVAEASSTEIASNKIAPASRAAGDANGNDASPTEAQIVAAPAAAPGAPNRTIEARTDYLLGPGDKIRLIVYQEPTLSGEFEVNSAGKLSLPLLGEINARGTTVSAIAATVSAQLSNGYVRDARVAAEVIVYRPFYILGEVTKPGEYPYGAQEVSVLKAVATAGGFTYRAKKSFVYIKRADKDVEERFRLTPDLKVQPGDVVRVAERFF